MIYLCIIDLLFTLRHVETKFNEQVWCFDGFHWKDNVGIFSYILKNLACVSFTDQGNINHTHVMTSCRQCIFDVNICCLNIVITLSVNQQEQIQIARNTFLCSLVLLSTNPQIHIDVILNDNYSRYNYYRHWAKSTALFLGRANITLQEVCMYLY